MSEHTLIIPSVPEHGWRIASTAFVFGILLLGVTFYVCFRSEWTSFWTLWFGFIGSIAVLTLFSWRTEIQSQRKIIVRRLFFVAVIPLWRRSYTISECDCIKRYIGRAWGYDNGSDGIYRPSIWLVQRNRKPLKLQEFLDCGDNKHPLSEEWAHKIAVFSGLEVKEVIESW